MSRRPQTCADCARRKIKCSKTIPCDNCQKRGCAHLCRLADIAHSVERRRTPVPLSPGAPVLRPADGDSTINEKILNLVTTLSERVKQLESKLDVVQPSKRFVPEQSSSDFLDDDVHIHLEQGRPAKRARSVMPSIPRSFSNGKEVGVATDNADNDSSTGQNSSDAEAEDAATVLEFLAWGRLKDSNLTSGIRDQTAHDPPLCQENDILQTAQAWNSPTSIPGGNVSVEMFQISQIQDMLPTKTLVLFLVEFHADWLLFMHCAFHAPSFLQELHRFNEEDEGKISMTSNGLQWAALLFAIICGSMTCARPAQVSKWGFREEEQSILAKRWYQASTDCLNAARYQQYHNVYSVQTIASSTICAHMLGFSNSQSVMLASAVRIGQSLGLHRLEKPKRFHTDQVSNSIAEVVQKELGRRLWQQLTTQDWFSVPFSDTYCVNPLHFSTQAPLHCNEATMEPIRTSSQPAITTYGNFLFKVASLMPALQDQLLGSQTLETKYGQVLRFDKLMREIVISQLPSCLNGQTALDPSWPPYVAVARRCLTITSAHKIIMIHRRFLGLSFHDKKYAFTRRTCLAAAKTIINEMKQDFSEESPILWTTQAFSVAAAIILALDNFNKNRSAQESEEHRQLISDTISILSSSIGISSIAARGTRLLTDLLAEEQRYFHSSNGSSTQNNKQQGNDGPKSEKSLNVAAFVKKFCESDDPPAGNSPLATSHMPLWLQQEETMQQYPNPRRVSDEFPGNSRGMRPYMGMSNRAQPSSAYDDLEGYNLPAPNRRPQEIPVDPFTQNLTDAFDIKSLNWFDDLLGLAPSHSI